MYTITVKEFQSIILSNPDLPSDMPESFWEWFCEYFTVINGEDSLPFD